MLFRTNNNSKFDLPTGTLFRWLRAKSNEQLVKLTGEITLQAAAAGGSDNALPKFNMRVNSGRQMMRLEGFPLPVIVDLQGVYFDKPNTPVIWEHDTNKRIGHSIDQSVSADGILASCILSSDSDYAKSFLTDSKKGFPFQCSVGGPVEEGYTLEAGQSAIVNGETFMGPCIIATKVRVREFSVAVLGADSQTSARIAASNPKGPTMNFEDFVKSLGLDPANLTAAQKASLTAHFESHKTLQATAKTPTTPPAAPLPVGTPVVPTVAPVMQAAGPAGIDLSAQRQAQADEEERVSNIRATASRFDSLKDKEIEIDGKKVKFATLKATAIRDGWSADKYELTLRRADYPEVGTAAPAGHVRDGEINAKAVEVAVIRAISPQLHGTKVEKANGYKYGTEVWYDEKTLEASEGPAYRGMCLHYLMDMNIRAAGMNFSGSRRDDRAFMRTFLEAEKVLKAATGFSTLAVSNILENVANKTLLASYKRQATIWNQICAIKSLNDFKPHAYYRMFVNGGYDKIGADGELHHGTFADEKYTLAAETYGMILALTRKDVRNDDLDAFSAIPTEMGRLAAIAIESAVFELLFTLIAGGTFFSTANGNRITTGSDLGINGLTLANKTLGNQTKDGKPILVNADRILVGKQDEVIAKQLFTDTEIRPVSTAGGFIRNPHVGSFNPIVSPYMNNTAIKKMDGTAFTGQDEARWLMFVDPSVLAALYIGFLDGRMEPVIESGTSDFDQLGMQWRSYHDWGVAAGDPKGALEATGAT